MTPKEQGLKEARDYYRKVQSEHVTELVLEERKRVSRRKRQDNRYAGVKGVLPWT